MVIMMEVKIKKPKKINVYAHNRKKTNYEIQND